MATITIPEQGAALIERYWADCIQARIDIPRVCDERYELFRQLRRDVDHELHGARSGLPASAAPHWSDQPGEGCGDRPAGLHRAGRLIYSVGITGGQQ